MRHCTVAFQLGIELINNDSHLVNNLSWEKSIKYYEIQKGFKIHIIVQTIYEVSVTSTTK